MKKKVKFRLLLALIILLSLFLRFYNFSSRYLIYSDQARDAMVARGVLKHKTLPLIGSFSSAGPFVFGPLYYWTLFLAYLIAPNFLISPWVLFVLFDIGFVFVMLKIGKLLWGKKGALITGLMAAVSTAQILRSSNINQPTLVSFFTALAIFYSIFYFKKKKAFSLFLMAISIGVAVNLHYQALNLLIFGLIIFFEKKFKLKNIVSRLSAFFLGLILPNLPLLYWDFQRNWANIRNILDYFLLGQYRIWVGNRWLTYLFDFWPDFWAKVIGGNYFIGFILMFFIGIFILLGFCQKKLKKETLFLGIVFLIQLVLYRYYRGQRSLGYVLYFHPLILLFSSWLILKIIKLNKIAGYLFFSWVIIFTFKQDIIEIKTRNNGTAEIWQTIEFLKKRYSGQKFSVYDFYYLEPAVSQMLSLFLDFKSLSSESGEVILGVSQGRIEKHIPIYKVQLEKEFYIYELDEKIVDENREAWVNVNPNYVYNDILYWWKKKPLKSTFYLSEFLIDKFLK